MANIGVQELQKYRSSEVQELQETGVQTNDLSYASNTIVCTPELLNSLKNPKPSLP
jgi:hypothetical protein